MRNVYVEVLVWGLEGVGLGIDGGRIGVVGVC